MSQNVPECPSYEGGAVDPNIEPIPEPMPKPTPWFDRLKPAKQAAIKHLVEGASLSETARRVGVDRKTIGRWLRDDPTFEFALRDKLKEAWGECSLGMASHAQKAINKLVGALDYRDPNYHLSAARFLLSLTPLGRGRSPVGPYLPWGG